MIEVTTIAQQQLNEYFADKEAQPIRIYLTSGGCSGPRLMLALDEPGEGDEVMETGGLTYVMDKDLYAQAKPLTVDLGPMGFEIASSLELGGGCCPSGGCSSGSCGC